MTEHVHPYSGKVIEGTRLGLGEKVAKTDRYASDGGEWKPPGLSVGITIESTKVYWVRPASSSAHPRISYSIAVPAK